MDFRFYSLVFLRRLPWFLLMLVIGSAAGLVLARVLPPVFDSKALLVVENEQIPDSLAASTVQTGAAEQLQIIQQRILARDNLIDMANRLRIYGEQAGPNRMTADEIVTDLRQRINIAVSGSSTQRGTTQATLVNVGFQASSATMAATVANEVVTMILRENVSMRTTVARQTLDFFEQEVTRLDQDLSRVSARILSFKESNREALPDSLEFRRSQLSSAQLRMQDLDRQEAQLRERRTQVERLKASAANGTVAPSGPQTPEQKRLQDLRQELTQAQAVMTATNPRRIMLESQVAAQEKIVSAQLAAQGAVSGDGSAVTVFDLQLSDIDGQLSFITIQRTQTQTQMEQLQRSIDATPANAVQLDTMEREYANVQSQYNEAVSKRARASTGEVIEALSRGQRISVIEQAVAPTRPTSPNRPVIALAGIAGGGALGLALVALIELLRPGIRRPAELTAKLGITPLMSLPYIRSPRETSRRRMVILATLVAAAVGVSVLLWLVHTRYMPLDILLEQVGRRLNLAGRMSHMAVA